MKENLNIALQGDIERSFEAEARHHIECTFTADHKEAAAAFVDKRTPEFGAR
jgi:2-(1,2-epoxy-1,2-dihydrophenyl)acetyl-CoA isomerase